MQLFLKKIVKKKNKRRADKRKLLQVMDKFMVLVVIMVSRARNFLQINEVVLIKFLQFCFFFFFFWYVKHTPIKQLKKGRKEGPRERKKEDCSDAFCVVQRFQNVLEMF